ncbi:MAG: hypothetical protein AW07_00861 [Candidatus Accumulibacter sp. SK-11]|nr:MAG: hypothetical protein AW07_00861 [Candidatus Accumulibacter sp. SK-11]
MALIIRGVSKVMTVRLVSRCPWPHNGYLLQCGRRLRAIRKTIWEEA